ncbi:MAG: fibronectin type III domain-containing protein [Candidatus Dormibacteraeota bacterium]|nr:fibronectin type III domain-containing protein [Candidatus Dormibacteraeota bacterium]
MSSDSPRPDNYLNNATCVSADDCWAVGGESIGGGAYQALAERYTGGGWTAVSTPFSSGSSFNGVACPGDAACWAVGFSRTGSVDDTLMEQFNGASWSVASAAPVAGFFGDVACVTATECWAVGSSGSSTFQPLIYRYNGSAWSAVAAPAGVGSSGFNYVTCINASDCWAVGYQSTGSAAGSNFQNLIEQYNGASWSVVSAPNVGPAGTWNALSGVACTGASNCWATGIYANPASPQGYFQQVLEQYNGTAWSVVPSPNVGLATIPSDVDCVDATDCWAVGWYLPAGSQTNESFAEQITVSGPTIVGTPNSGSYPGNVLVGITCTNTPSCWAVGQSYNSSTATGATLAEQSVQPQYAAAATNVSASSRLSAQATVTFTAPSYTGTSSITAYTVFIFDSGGPVGTQPVSSSPATVTGLTNGRWYEFAVGAVNASGTGTPSGLSDSVTPFSGVTPPSRTSAVSSNQYFLPNSDGSTWQNIDETTLSLSLSPSTSSTVILSGNADFWTFDAGYNQDLGIAISVNGASPTVVGWKESGGFAGTFSPNAAFLQTPYEMTSGSTYGVWLVWKTNKPAIGAHIATGAGSPENFSPTSLHADVLPAGTDAHTAVSTQQYTLPDSDGSSWHPIDTSLSFTITPSSSSAYVLSGNADLWTFNAGYNQDIGVCVAANATMAPNPCPAGDVVAWKESGGFAGTFSPNAAFVQTVQELNGATSYSVSLVWKANKPAGGIVIAAAAGPSAPYSPTRLTAWSAGDAATAVSTRQYSLPDSNGSFTAIDSTNLSTQFAATTDENVLVSVNTDLWTANAGYNQDVGIIASNVATPSPALIGWKESGGFAGTFSPNAAFLEVSYPVTAGNTYQFSVVWKTNIPAASSNVTIYAGAGPIAGEFSPTRITILPAGGLPGAPTGVAATTSTPGSAAVSWSAPTDSGGSPITSYAVTTYDANGNVAGSTSAPSSPATVTGLTNDHPYFFGVAAVSGGGAGPHADSNSVTPVSGSAPATRLTASSTSHYALPNSDGATWQPIDDTNLGLSITPAVTGSVLLTANSTLSTTSTDGNNDEDIGIEVNGSLVSWREAAGQNPPFQSAILVQALQSVTAGTPYTVEIVWKSERPLMGARIEAGTGPAGGPYSPTTLNVQTMSAANGAQEMNTGSFTDETSDGTTWTALSTSSMTLALAPSATGYAVLSAQTDLYSSRGNVGLDLGICLLPGTSTSSTCPQADIVAWNEVNPGYALSQAVSVQAVAPVTGGSTYIVELVWKTAGSFGSIFTGDAYSAGGPTQLIAYTMPPSGGAAVWSTVSSSQQYSLPSSDGSTWHEMDAANLVSQALSPSADETVLVTATADPWAVTASRAQDLALFVSVNGGAPTTIGWVESGGSSATSNPTATAVQAEYTLGSSGGPYVFSLWWKSDPADSSGIYDGAGPLNGNVYSSTTLTVLPGG